MKTKQWWAGGLALVAAAGVTTGYLAGRARAAGIPATAAMTYGGVLTDMSGTPLTGSKNIQVALWDAASAGAQQCITPSSPQSLVAGAFQVVLPDACTAAVHANSDLWVDLVVDGASLGRTKLGAVPFAVEADHAVNATSATNAIGTLAQQVVPAGAVMFFNSAACPGGWSDLPAAQGRYIVGMPANGTLAAVVGTALSDQENRPTGQHTHSVNDPGHDHTIAPHNHTATASVNDPGHDHNLPLTSGSGGLPWFWANFGAGATATAHSNPNTTGITVGVTVNNSGTLSTNAVSTGIAVANAGTVGGTNAPYVELRICQKN
jgi:hypothetical protein